MEKELEVIEGYYRRTIYQSVQYGASIVVYQIGEENETLTGIMLPVLKNIKYRFTGTWVKHPKYGKQFRVTSYEELVENNEQSIIEYLSSGIIKGIGRRTAEKIVKHFGLRTLDIMEQDISQLQDIKGITSAKLLKIDASFKSTRASRDIAMRLSRYGISPKLSSKVYQMFGADAMDIIDNKPFLLCLVKGISFPQADAIAKKTDEYETSYERFKICANYVLYQNENNGFKNIIGNRTSGSTGIDKDDFGKVMLTLLHYKNINGSFICENTIRMIREGNLIYKNMNDKQLLFLPGIFRIENAIADNIYRLCNNKPSKIDNIEKQIDDAENTLGIHLGLMQRKAVMETFKNGLSLIIGPPGSGKTTTIKVIAYIYRRNYNNNIQFLAPTGKASSRIKESSGFLATTIHSGINIGTEIINDLVEKPEIVYANCLLGVDEMSMVDVRTAYQLFEAVGDNTIMVLCGDADQLQSVGAGAVLRDMIESKVLPVTELDMVYRTAKGSNIYINADKIRKGQTDLQYGDDFKFHEVSSPKEMEQMMISCYLKKIETYGIENVMMPTPFKEHDAGVNPLNINIQAILNPSAVQDKIYWQGSQYYRVGDIVMHLKNNSEVKIVNGDIGVVTDITMVDGENALVVQYVEETMVYTSENIEDVTLAYAYTIHKSQGSEAKCVITSVHSMHSLMLRRNIFYTAITRGKEEVCIFGQKEAMKQAILTEDKSNRNTCLKMLLRLKFGEIIPISFIA